MLSISLALLPLLSLSLIRLATAAPPPPLPRRTIANVSVLDTPLVRAAEAYMRDHSDPDLYAHVMRSWLFGTLLVSHNATLASLIDPEVQAVSLLLHDLGLDRTNSGIVSPDRRFEVDGAIAARAFIRDHESGRRWDDRRVQLVWDAIALHTEQKYALHKEPDVQTVSNGIFTDFLGPGRGVTPYEYAAIVKEFPQGGLKTSFTDSITWLCSTKPATTYDTFMQPFGERFVAGYSAVGSRGIDLVLGSS